MGMSPFEAWPLLNWAIPERLPNPEKVVGPIEDTAGVVELEDELTDDAVIGTTLPLLQAAARDAAADIICR